MLVVVVAVVAVLVIRATGGGDEVATSRPLPAEHRVGSVAIEGGSALEIGDPPSSYRLVYRVEDWAGGQHVESTDVITVERPYRGRVEVQGGDRDAPSSMTVTDFGRVSIRGPDAQPLLVEMGPALAAFDLRIDAVLPDALERGVVERRELREVLDQRCQVIRTREPIAAGTLGSNAPTATHYTDNCIGTHGLVLEEVWVTDGKLLRRRLATELDRDPKVSTDAFEAFGRHLEPKEGGGSIRPVEPTTFPAGATFWEGLDPPEGFAFRGRYAVVPPQRSEVTEEEAVEANPLAVRSRDRIGAVTDVWERGIDLFVLEQGGTVDKSTVFELEPGAPTVEVAGLGTGQVILDGRLSELRFPLAGGRYLRILGTVPIDQLEAAAVSLRPAPEGSGLAYLDDEDHADDPHDS